MKAIFCQIETSLNFQQANKLIKELKPSVLVIPESYTQPPSIAPHKLDLVIDQANDRKVITFKKGEVIKLPLKRKRNRVYLSSEVAKSIIPKEVAPGTILSTITGCLQVKDNMHDIEQYDDALDTPKTSSSAPSRDAILKKTKYEWGTTDVDLFLKKLSQDGIAEVKVDKLAGAAIHITLQVEDTTIKIDEKSTHIVCGGKQSLRLKLRDFLMQCVQIF